MPQFVVIGPFEHANHKVMDVGHDWLEEDGDFSGFKGMIRSDAFHIVPNWGMGLFCFVSTESTKEALPGIRRGMHDYAQMFD